MGRSSDMPHTRTRSTLVIVSLALFMVVLDNLIVTVALPSIRADLGAPLPSLEWTLHAYTLALALSLIPGAPPRHPLRRERGLPRALPPLPPRPAAAPAGPA